MRPCCACPSGSYPSGWLDRHARFAVCSANAEQVSRGGPTVGDEGVGMRRDVRGLVLAGLRAVVTAAAMVGAGMEGWRYGVNRAPGPSGRGCFDPGAAGVALLCGLLGAFAGAALAAAAVSLVVLGLVRRHRSGSPVGS